MHSGIWFSSISHGPLTKTKSHTAQIFSKDDIPAGILYLENAYATSVIQILSYGFGSDSGSMFAKIFVVIYILVKTSNI